MTQTDPSLEMFKIVEMCLDKIEAQYNSKQTIPYMQMTHTLLDLQTTYCFASVQLMLQS